MRDNLDARFLRAGGSGDTLRSTLIVAGTGSVAGRAAGFAICGLVGLATVAAISPSAGPARARTSAVSWSAPAHRALTSVVTGHDWPAYLFSAGHSAVTTGPTAITLGNAGRLNPVWRFQQLPGTRNGRPQNGFSASPTAADQMVFIGSQTGDFYALRESTGQLVWKHTLDYQHLGNNGNCKHARGIVGTATVAAGPRTGRPTVYVPGARYLYAFHAATGALIWKSLVGPPGSAAVHGAYYNYASPTVRNGRVYEGVSSSCNKPFVRGGVQAFGQRTGKLQHSFWTVPAGKVGASVWSSEAAGNRSVYVTTGDPKFTGKRFYHAYSVLRLNSRTLRLRGSWQLHLPQAADLDFGSSPTLFRGTVHGMRTALVGACNKNGRYYALRRSALGRGPVWSVRVGVSAHPGPGMCLASAVWNAPTHQLYLAGNTTTIDGVKYDGSVREVNPGTGATRWATGLRCGVIGTPALDAATNVLAVNTWAPCLDGSPVVYLLNAKNGDILGTLPVKIDGFAQPVFAGRYLLVADESGQVVAYSPTAAKGHVRCAGWCTATHHQTPAPAIPIP